MSLVSEVKAKKNNKSSMLRDKTHIRSGTHKQKRRGSPHLRLPSFLLQALRLIYSTPLLAGALATPPPPPPFTETLSIKLLLCITITSV
jgi:hypothetical protein